MEGPTGLSIPEQNDSLEGAGGDKESLITIRTHKNLERGTELTYFTIPTEEAMNLSEEDLQNFIVPFK